LYLSTAPQKAQRAGRRKEAAAPTTQQLTKVTQDQEGEHKVCLHDRQTLTNPPLQDRLMEKE
jgi:hypothetical protein